MEKPTLAEFVDQVQRMRDHQRDYFAAAARASKTKLPEDWKKRANALKASKAAEEKVDASIIAIGHRVPEPKL